MGAFLFFVGCQGSTQETAQPAPAEVSIPFTKHGTLEILREGTAYLALDIEIADTDSAIIRGLMQRTSLPDMSGMLFLMPEEEPQQFWMGNTPMSLDIIFAKEDGEIVSIQKYTRPLSQQGVNSTYPAKLVLEVTAGFSDSHGLIEGDVLKWERM